MNLLGISWTAFAIGAAALATGLLALHLLRVRLQRVRVPTLLFFRAAARPERPRVLFGAPKRFLAYLLALAGLLAAWTAFADPAVLGEGRSRVVLVDASGSGAVPDASGAPRLRTRLAHARELANAGLGPRGAVFAYAATTAPLWLAGEAALLLDARASAVVASGSGAGFWDALHAARARLRDGDEILLLGGPELPTGLETPATNGLGVRVVRAEDATSSAPVEPEREAPPQRALTLAFVGAVPRAVRLAVAADPSLTVVAAPASADVVIARGEEAVDKPCLRIVDGEGDDDRVPVATREAPFALSLRDRRQLGPALRADAAATPWVVDARSGAALVQARTEPGREVTVVGWFAGLGTAELAHQDLPRLVLGALALLRTTAELPVQTSGDRLRVPALTPSLATLHEEGRADAALTSLASEGAHELPLAASGRFTLTTAGATRTFTVVAHGTPPATAAQAGSLASVAHDGRLRSLALWIALVLLLTDLLLYAKGRLP